MAGKYNVCLDIGGTKVLGAIFNEKGEIVHRLKKRSRPPRKILGRRQEPSAEE